EGQGGWSQLSCCSVQCALELNHCCYVFSFMLELEKGQAQDGGARKVTEEKGDKRENRRKHNTNKEIQSMGALHPRCSKKTSDLQKRSGMARKHAFAT
ncbi:hypothetical protein GOODEAATRI_000329, partial [Goodea atripinnis]